MNLFSRTHITALLSAALVSTASAVTISPALVGGSGDVDNVLFQAGGTGTTVDASLNTTGGIFIARFSSSTDTLTVAGGQASLQPVDGTLGQLTFRLIDGGFTKLQLNPDAILDGSIRFDVTYITPSGTLANQVFLLNSSGQNFFTILAQGTEIITSVSYLTDPANIVDTGQFRVGGAVRTTTSVPDGGTTITLMGLALLVLAAARRKFLA